MVDCITLITLIVGYIATLGSIACMFLWNRAEANADRRDMNTKIEANMKETRESIEANMKETRERIEANMKETREKIDSNMNQTRALIDVIRQESKDFQAAIHQEAKDFHARLCVIESERKFFILNEKGQNIVTRGE